MANRFKLMIGRVWLHKRFVSVRVAKRRGMNRVGNSVPPIPANKPNPPLQEVDEYPAALDAGAR